MYLIIFIIQEFVQGNIIYYMLHYQEFVQGNSNKMLEFNT